MFTYNPDWRRRDAILRPYFYRGHRSGEYTEDYKLLPFAGLPVEVVEQLISEKFLRPDEMQNSSPTAAVMLAFMSVHPGTTAHGYAVTFARGDYRVTLEGIEYEGSVTEEIRRDAEATFGEADEYEERSNGLYVWYE